MSPLADRLAQLRREGGFFPIGPRTRISVSGADRVRYLNGQLTNNVKRLVPGVAQAALVLTGKGKLCADVFLWIDGETLVVDADPLLAEILPARLERYAISDDVQFDLLPAEPTGFHAFGPLAESLPGLKIRRLAADGIDLVEAPATGLQATAEEIEILRIERGVPRWGSDLGEDTLPQEAGLEETAVDFHKGCYVGQETVSRIESVGRVNRQLTGFIGDFPPDQAIGAVLLGPAGEKSGTLTSATAHPVLGRTIALGYLQTRSESKTFSVQDESGACLGTAERSEFPLLS